MSWQLLPLLDTCALYHLAEAWGVSPLPRSRYEQLVDSLSSGTYDPRVCSKLAVLIFAAAVRYALTKLWGYQFKVDVLTTSVVLKYDRLPDALITVHALRHHHMLPDNLNALRGALVRLNQLWASLGTPSVYSASRSSCVPFAPTLRSMFQYRDSMPRLYDDNALVLLPTGNVLNTSLYNPLRTQMSYLGEAPLQSLTFTTARTVTAFFLLTVEYMTLYHELAAALANNQPGVSGSAVQPDVAHSVAQPLSRGGAATAGLPADDYHRFLTRLAQLAES